MSRGVDTLGLMLVTLLMLQRLELLLLLLLQLLLLEFPVITPGMTKETLTLLQLLLFPRLFSWLVLPMDANWFVLVGWLLQLTE